MVKSEGELGVFFVFFGVLVEEEEFVYILTIRKDHLLLLSFE